MSLPDEDGWVADRIAATARHRRQRTNTDLAMRVAAWACLAVVALIAILSRL